MNLFDHLVDEALRSGGDFSTLRSVVEKELLHHDILREMKNDFMDEMRRFLPAATVRNSLENPAYWSYLTQLLYEQGIRAIKSFAEDDY